MNIPMQQYSLVWSASIYCIVQTEGYMTSGSSWKSWMVFSRYKVTEPAGVTLAEVTVVLQANQGIWGHVWWLAGWVPAYNQMENINAWRPEQNGRHLADDNAFSWKKSFVFQFKFRTKVCS